MYFYLYSTSSDIQIEMSHTYIIHINAMSSIYVDFTYKFGSLVCYNRPSKCFHTYACAYDACRGSFRRGHSPPPFEIDVDIVLNKLLE
jgi:hypothetical protein